MSPIRPTAALMGTFLLIACTDPVTRDATAPPGAAPGTCWAKAFTPAVIKTVTEQVLVEPQALAPDGSVVYPAAYRTETHQEIVEDRRESWFETPCPEAMSGEVVASLQRALNVRGFYHGPITGRMDRPTRAAIRAYQTSRGIASDILAMDTARDFGLVPVSPAQS